ncbi:MAG: hypothetical protein OWS74_00590 [Firmicutes bacterium]|nr:hypothetical protein [Bacillota bacterium]
MGDVDTAVVARIDADFNTPCVQNGLSKARYALHGFGGIALILGSGADPIANFKAAQRPIDVVQTSASYQIIGPAF